MKKGNRYRPGGDRSAPRRRWLSPILDRMRRRPFLIGLGACLLLLALPGWLLWRHWRTEAQLARLERENVLLAEKNRATLAEIARLRQDDRYLEKVAREQGLVGRDEVLYRFVKRKDAARH